MTIDASVRRDETRPARSMQLVRMKARRRKEMHPDEGERRGAQADLPIERTTTFAEHEGKGAERNHETRHDGFV
jgi:hypothetical protein